MRPFRSLLMLGSLLLFTGCADQLDSYRGTTPVMQFDRFFAGPVEGHGIVQDRSGKIIRRFDVAMNGSWHGDDFVLAEHFKYYDGKTQDRAWHVRKIAANEYVGRAADIIGDAPGRQEGSAIRWRYVMQVPTQGGNTYDMTFDDWMYMMNDDVVINRSFMKKFGVQVAELTITMRKLPGKP